MSAKRIEIELPFSGFYESWHDDKLNNAIEYSFQDDDGNVRDDLYDKMWEADINWEAIRSEYCKHFVDEFASEFNLDLQFLEMTSPREYNFSSDRLFVSIPEDQINKIRQEVESSPKWAERVNERYTSRSGFWSNYSNDVKEDEWTRPVLDECQYLTMLECWIDIRHEDDPNNNKEWLDLEWLLMDEIEVYGFESVNNAINEIDKILTTEVK